MTARVVRRTAAVVAAALGVGSASAASAATWSHTDAKGDVLSSSDGGTTTAPAPTNLPTDVTSVRAVNGTGSVIVRVRTRSALPAKDFIAELDIKTSTSRYSAARYSIDGASGVMFSRGSTDKTCSGLKVAVDRSTSVTTFTVPRACLGDPGWVKVGIGLMTSNSDDSVEWADDGLRSGMGANDLTFSPRIARG